jgi:hypothetical protein
LARGRERLSALRARLARDAAERAWADMAGRFSAVDGVLARVAAFDFAGAGALAEEVLSGIQDEAAAAHARALAGAIDRGRSFLQRYRAALPATEVTLALSDEDEPATVTAVTNEGGAPGFTVKMGPRSRQKAQFVPLATLSDAAVLDAFLAVDEEAGDRAAFLALTAMVRHHQAAAAYLRRVQPGNPASGTGPDAYPTSLEPAARARRALARLEPEWAGALGRELEATLAVAKGLHALSRRNNLTAAAHLRRALQEHPRSLIVAALR